MDLSVIIPVFNGERYIRRILTDLHKQSVKSVEFLIINDGSTDSTKKIITDYIDEINDDRFILINKLNGGVSSARNVGLDKSIGKYIVFVDSDDRLAEGFLELYLSRIRKNKTDIEVFSATKVIDGKTLKSTGLIDYSPISRKKSYSSKEYMKLFAELKAWGYPFCYIFRRELWDNVRFNNRIKYQEDVLAFFNIWASDGNLKIHVNGESKYYYVWNEKSALRKMSTEGSWQFVEVDDLVIDILKFNRITEVIPYVNALKESSLIIVITYALLEDKYKDYEKARKSFIDVYDQAIFGSRKIKLRRKIQYLILRLDMKWIMKLIYRKIR